jgi:Delta7-sterol 5-desaturase
MTISSAISDGAAGSLLPIDWPGMATSVGFAVLGGLSMYLLIGGYFELAYYRRKADASSWKCQPRRWPSPKARRDELVLGTANLTAASLASGLFVYYVRHGGYTSLYFSLAEHGATYTLLSGVAYLLGTDLALYWAHRLFHSPALYRRIHKVHHRWTSPTAFTAMAMHPVEFVVYQSIMAVPLFVVPLHVGAVIAVLVMTNYYALVDHSGIKLRSWLPFIAPAQFHDDHHAHFHVNYGQSFFLWDRLFGTMRRQNRRYGAAVFGGRGEGDGGDASDAPLWDYDKEAPAASPAPADQAPAE